MNNNNGFGKRDHAFIVTKKCPCKMLDDDGKTVLDVEISINEAVFATNDLANEYIKKRLAIKDRDDKNCTFSVEPWILQDTLNIPIATY